MISGVLNQWRRRAEDARKRAYATGATGQEANAATAEHLLLLDCIHDIENSIASPTVPQERLNALKRSFLALGSNTAEIIMSDSGVRHETIVDSFPVCSPITAAENHAWLVYISGRLNEVEAAIERLYPGLRRSS